MDLEVCRGHLVDEDVLYGRAVAHRVSIEDDGLRIGVVVGADGFAVGSQSLVEGLNKLSGSCARLSQYCDQILLHGYSCDLPSVDTLVNVSSVAGAIVVCGKRYVECKVVSCKY